MAEAKNYLVGSALAISLGINGILVGAGLAEATTVPTVIAGVEHKAVAQSAVSGWRTTAANALCAQSEAANGLGDDDCSAANVCTISVQMCDEKGALLEQAQAAVKFVYPANAVLQ